MKIQKNRFWGGGGGRVRWGVRAGGSVQRIEDFGKMPKKFGEGGSGWGGGQDGCERRSEVIVKIQVKLL